MRYSDAFPDDEETPLVQIEQKESVFPKLTKQEYIAVLETEKETLTRYYFKPDEEGTGHFNTAAMVLEHRINELKAQL
jgi:hypothetical protein